MAKASCTKARQNERRKRRRKRNMPWLSLGRKGTGRKVGRSAGSSSCNRWGFRCINVGTVSENAPGAGPSAPRCLGRTCRTAQRASFGGLRSRSSFGGEILAPEFYFLLGLLASRHFRAEFFVLALVPHHFESALG